MHAPNEGQAVRKVGQPGADGAEGHGGGEGSGREGEGGRQLARGRTQVCWRGGGVPSWRLLRVHQRSQCR